VASVARAYPGYDYGKPMKYIDGGSSVKVYYPLPEGWAGGSPEVEIQKRSCKVLRVYRTQ
jgi:hypothetical protein